MSERLTPARLVSPGSILKRELAARGWSQKDLAHILDKPEQTISAIIKGKKQLMPDMAVALGEALGQSPGNWMRLEADYRVQLSQRQESSGKIETMKLLYERLPLREVLKRGWVRSGDSIDELVASVCEFMRIESPEDEPEFSAQFRGSAGKTADIPSRNAWVRRVQALAEQQDVKEYEASHFERDVTSVLDFSEKPKDVKKVKPFLAELGVRFVIVAHLPRTYLDGAALSVGDGQPVVAMTLRYKRVDSFWFTLMHELAHLVQGDGSLYVDQTEGGGEVNDEERRANKKAQEWLVPQERLKAFLNDSGRRPAREDIVDFAAEIERHPGIVLGQIHKRRNSYRLHRDLLEDVKRHLSKLEDKP